MKIIILVNINIYICIYIYIYILLNPTSALLFFSPGLWRHQEFLVGLHGDTPPPGYRHMTRADLTDVALRTRLVAAHQSRGGWGLAKDPLPVKGPLVVAEGMLQINHNPVAMLGAGLFGSTAAHNVYEAINGRTNVLWRRVLPAVDASWTAHTSAPTGPEACLLVRDPALGQTSGT
jgi:hypothetical protein